MTSLSLVAFAGILSAVVAHAGPLEKWIYCQRNLQVDKSVDELDELMRRGAAAGYTHLLLADSKLARLGTLGSMSERYFRNAERVKQLAAQHRIEIVPAIFHIGYSNDMLWHDPNLIEGLPVKHVPLVVQSGAAKLASAPVTLPGGDFLDLEKWSWKDDNVVPDQGTARVNANGQNGRIVQKLKLQPWRQYHVSVRIKTQDLKGAVPEIKAIPADGRVSVLNWDNLGTKPTQDWTTHHAVFNSLEYTDISLFFGTWGAASGVLWWDDATIEEVAFLNIIRRAGAPLAVAREAGTFLLEGRDFEALADPLMGTKPWAGSYDVYHAPPILKTKLPDGTRLRASYYHTATIHDGQAMVCPSEPRTYELLRDEARRVHGLWGAKKYMMSHDEVRVMNWCAACQARNLTPGQQLADNVKRCIQILRETAPQARAHVWSDMFDPHHNARKSKYYLVNGDLTGSWEGLDRKVVILPWYFGKRAESLQWFAGRGHPQIIAGYYDGQPERLADWLSAAKGLPGLIGVMYTTWKNNYKDLEKFSEVAGGSNDQGQRKSQ
ncbi:MAG: hypothetical protein M3463_16630 [Verrucomicrobiota bacterium]|nr:hypothetical protein [Verrucomicrobiota bacterium]